MQGVITHSNRTYLKSYPMLLELVQHMFPPIDTRDSLMALEAQQDFNAFNFWRPLNAFPDSSDDDAHDSDDDGGLDAGTAAMYGAL